MRRASRVALPLTIVAVMALMAACGEDAASPSEEDPAGSDAATAEPTEESEEDSGTQSTSETGGSEDEDAAEAGAGLTVVSPVYPLQWVAQQVAPAADVSLLTDQGEDPHDIELSPRDRELVEVADAVLYMGDLDYQPQVETAVEAASGHVVSFAEAVGTETLRTWEDHDHSHDDDHTHDDEDAADDDHTHDDAADDDHTHDDAAYDPHAWFDAAGMAVMTRAIGEAFAEIDPDAAETYTENADDLAAEFVELDSEISETLGGSCTYDYVVVSHEAYAYLLEPFGHQQEGVSGAGGHGPASPQRIAELADRIAEDDIEYVLTEPIEGREDAEGVAQEAGVELLEIYSLEVIDEQDHFETHGFLELLRQQAETAATALDCG